MRETSKKGPNTLAVLQTAGKLNEYDAVAQQACSVVPDANKPSGQVHPYFMRLGYRDVSERRRKTAFSMLAGESWPADIKGKN